MQVNLRTAQNSRRRKRYEHEIYCYRESFVVGVLCLNLLFPASQALPTATVETMPEPSPQKRRLKTYSAESGFVFQYLSESTSPHQGQFLFWISRDGANFQPILIQVFDPSDLLQRPARAPEVYAIAKFRLLEWFDSEFDPSQSAPSEALLTTTDQATRYAEVLGLIEN
jgi:hypothetical protein